MNPAIVNQEVGADGPATRAERACSGNFDLEPYVLPITWIGIIVLFGILRPSTFLTGANISSTLSSQAVLVVVGLAVLAPLIVGDLDVSVGAVVGLSAMIVVLLNVSHHVNAFLAALLAVLAAAVVGLVNGVLATVLNLDLLIITLGTGSLLTGIVAWISAQQTITGFPDI